MGSQSFWGILGFTLTAVGLFLYAYQTQDPSGQLTTAVIAVSAWWLESHAVRRSPVDFSTGFLFYLILALSGDALGALLALLGGFCVRRLSGHNHVADLGWFAPLFLTLAVVQSLSGWPEDGLLKGLICVSAMLAAFFLNEFGSKAVVEKYRRQQSDLSGARLETRQRELRRLLLLYAPAGALLPAPIAWLSVLALPLCWAIQRSALDMGYRVHAQGADEMKDRMKESFKMLEQTQGRLAKASEKQVLLEEMTAIFARPLSPEQAFQELCRVTAAVVEYRSVVLFQIGEEGGLIPALWSSPEPDLLAQSLLIGKREPLVEKAWQQERAVMGTASTVRHDRLLALEPQLVAVPMKPAGVFYFGREENRPFAKQEAALLLFVVRRAAPALQRAEKEKAAQQALVHQSKQSELLRAKVALSHQLLEAAQEILAAVRTDQVTSALETSLRGAVPHDFGAVLLGDELQSAQQWGAPQGEPSSLLALGEMVKREQRAIYLPDLQRSRIQGPAPEISSVIAAPLPGDSAQTLGVLIIGSVRKQAFNDEQHNFICTCACLASAGLTSLGLFAKLESAHQQVVQASKLSAIGRLAATVAHELNTPLAAIGLALEAVSLRPEKAGEKLNRASNALDRAREIVRGLLHHARHSGSERVLVDVERAVLETRELLAPQLQRRAIRLDTDCPKLSSKILANQTDLQQVLINLVLNAADASPDGSQVLLSVHEKGPAISLAVRDWGSGIATEHQDRLFDPFFTTKEAGLGTGLGLSVCRQLVERHQGLLTYSTEFGQGTTFCLEFPARHPEGESTALKF